MAGIPTMKDILLNNYIVVEMLEIPGILPTLPLGTIKKDNYLNNYILCQNYLKG